MADGRGNIDLVFRNGLKDYEVVPPLDVWTNIKPALDRKRKNMFFLRSAASIAVLISVGAFAYMWGYETSKERFSAELINANINYEPVTPVDIAIPLAIMQDETPATLIGISPKVVETVYTPLIAQLDTLLDEIYIESNDIDESTFIAEAESFTEIHAPLVIDYANLFSLESQSIIFNICFIKKSI